MQRFFKALGTACFLFMPVAAQSQSDWSDYFYRSMTADKGTPVTLPADANKKISEDKIGISRDFMWKAWLNAVRRRPVPHLIPAAALSDSSRGELAIPDSLEPAAVMPYYYGLKGDLAATGNTSVPTYLYLHGSGPKAQEWAASLSWAKIFADAPSRYFIPQIPNEAPYYRWWQRSKQWAWTWLWQQLTLTPGFDPDRFYIFGISEGGYGSQRLASYYADYLAAAGPMAGGEPLINAPAENLSNIGFSLLTGAKDYAFCRDRYTRITGETLDSLAQSGSGIYAHRVQLIPEMGHGIDYRPTTPWLSQFRRNPWPRRFVWEDFAMDGRHRSGFYNLRSDRQLPDSIRLRYDVDMCTPNIVKITVNRVEYIPTEKDTTWNMTLRWNKQQTLENDYAFTVLLDEHLINMNEPVTVIVNGRRVFRGKLRPTLSAMGESIATYGDLRRIFTTKVSVSNNNRTTH